MPRVFSMVLIPLSVPADKISDAVSKLLNPHAYYHKFEPYRVPCVDCSRTSDEGIHTANEQVGDFHYLWHVFRSIPEDQRPEWKSYIAGWEQTAINAAFSSPHYQPPDSECKIRGGSGIATVTYAVGGFVYEWRSMREDEWANFGPVKHLTESSDSYEILVTPDGQVYKRWGYRSLGKEEWKAKTRGIWEQHLDCIAFKILINI